LYAVTHEAGGVADGGDGEIAHPAHGLDLFRALDHPEPRDVVVSVLDRGSGKRAPKVEDEALGGAPAEHELRFDRWNRAAPPEVDAKLPAALDEASNCGGKLGDGTRRLDAGSLREIWVRREEPSGEVVRARGALVAGVALGGEDGHLLRVRVESEHGVGELETREVEEVVELPKGEPVGRARPAREEQDPTARAREARHHLVPPLGVDLFRKRERRPLEEVLLGGLDDGEQRERESLHVHHLVSHSMRVCLDTPMGINFRMLSKEAPSCGNG
jgi:hypothetical protein